MVFARVFSMVLKVLMRLYRVGCSWICTSLCVCGVLTSLFWFADLRLTRWVPPRMGPSLIQDWLAKYKVGHTQPTLHKSHQCIHCLTCSPWNPSPYLRGVFCYTNPIMSSFVWCCLVSLGGGGGGANVQVLIFFPSIRSPQDVHIFFICMLLI